MACHLQVLGALGLASSLVISYGLALVVRVSPWYDPQYLIPMMVRSCLAAAGAKQPAASGFAGGSWWAAWQPKGASGWMRKAWARQRAGVPYSPDSCGPARIPTCVPRLCAGHAAGQRLLRGGCGAVHYPG